MCSAVRTRLRCAEANRRSGQVIYMDPSSSLARPIRVEWLTVLARISRGALFWPQHLTRRGTSPDRGWHSGHHPPRRTLVYNRSAGALPSSPALRKPARTQARSTAARTVLSSPVRLHSLELFQVTLMLVRPACQLQGMMNIRIYRVEMMTT